MFDYNSMIKRVVTFFPRWMDIRKRYKTSTGGKILGSIVEEICDLESALNEYKKYYFLESYESHEDEVVAFVLKGNIGIVKDMDSLKITNPNMEVTTDIKTFLSSNAEDKLAYYEEGFIYVRLETNLSSITFEIDEYSSTADLHKTHVWNIFDEFACFVGLTRHPNESNAKLRDRILYINQNLPNNSADGLKHAIISELMTIEDVSIDDIAISTLTSDNLRKPYEEFNNLLDKLATINRDVIKNKIWDVDFWEYDFKSLEYIDHVWDKTLTKYSNGIGSFDDLKVLIADSNMTTDANITLYQKSTEKLYAYVHNKEINKKFKIEFLKYNNILNSMNLKYKVKASETLDITRSDVEVTAYDKSKKDERRTIQELYKIGSGISVIDNSKITNEDIYRLEFVPKDGESDLVIGKCNVLYKNKKTGKIEDNVNLLKLAPGFSFNADGELVNSNVKKKITSVGHFNESEGLTDVYNGITLDNGMTQGHGIIDVSQHANRYLKVQSDCDTDTIPKSSMRVSSNVIWYKDTLVFRNDTIKERTANIKLKANHITFDIIDKCAFEVYTTVDGVTFKEDVMGPSTYKSSKYDTAKDIEIKISVKYNAPIKMNNFRYSAYEIDYALDNGSLLAHTDNQFILPGFKTNNLKITLKTYCGKQPYINSISIGMDFTNVKFLTNTVKARTGYDRIFEIECKGIANLLRTDYYGNELGRSNNYIPTTLYKATRDDAFIRLNTDEYSFIERIITPVGYRETIEESGVQYHQIRLRTGDTISYVDVVGYRNSPVKKFNLLDMIKVYVKDFNEQRDKIYANRLVDGLIVEQNGVNSNISLVKLKSNELFAGIKAQKYKVTKMPKELKSVFITTTSGSVNSNEHEGAFYSLFFYPSESEIYTAVNDYNIYIPESRNIEITNNFNPTVNLNDMLVYTVEPMKNPLIDFDVRLHNWNESGKFETLKNWSLGRKKVAIKADMDLNNTDNFQIEVQEIEEEALLAQHIDIKNTYTDATGRVIQSDKYIIKPPKNTSIVYKTYSPDDPYTESLIKSEEIIVEEDGFNKLEYSNIDSILHLSTRPFGDNNEITIKDYNILNEQGIIVWTNNQLINSGQKIYIRYTIKKPIAFKYDTDQIYKEIGYDVEAYSKLDNILLKDLKHMQRLDLKQIQSYKEADLVFIRCSTPGFEAQISDDKLNIKKVAETNSLLVKTGYYYINGKEYYMFAEKDKLKLKDIGYADFVDVERSGGELTFVKKTNNFVMNSEMLLKGMGEICNINTSNTDIKGISSANSLTACENFNDWNTFSCSLGLTAGLNGVGINVMPTSTSGYAFINITDKLYDGKNYMSLFAEKDLKVYIGEEERLYGISFPRNLNIKTLLELNHDNENKLRACTLEKLENKNYYLLVRGNGVIDDIIISNKEIREDDHIKNIDKLGLNIEETTYNGYRYNIFIRDNKGIDNNGASLDSYGYIVNTSRLDWGITSIKHYRTRKDFLECETSNVSIEPEYLFTSEKRGRVITGPIFVDNPNIVRRLFYKINNTDFPEMKGFKINIVTSDKADGDYIPVSYCNDNVGFVYGEHLSRYIKLIIEIPKNKIIDDIDIFVEHKSTKDYYPKAYTISNGEIISKVYDAQYKADYRIKNIVVDELSSINDVEISIRTARDVNKADVWHEWKVVHLDDNLKVTNIIEFENSRFYQVRVRLKTKEATIKLKHIELEVM